MPMGGAMPGRAVRPSSLNTGRSVDAVKLDTGLPTGPWMRVDKGRRAPHHTVVFVAVPRLAPPLLPTSSTAHWEMLRAGVKVGGSPRRANAELMHVETRRAMTV